jgi:hypothetical protein
MRYGRHSLRGVPPHLSLALGMVDSVMIELLFIYQLARNPVQALARRWYCRGLFRATRGQRRCRECKKS